jgi:hypothetical protein
VDASSQYHFHTVCTDGTFSLSHREATRGGNLSSLSSRDVDRLPALLRMNEVRGKNWNSGYADNAFIFSSPRVISSRRGWGGC